MLTVLKCRSERVIFAWSKDTSTLSFVKPSSHRPQISFTFLSIKLVISAVRVHELVPAVVARVLLYHPSTEPLHEKIPPNVSEDTACFG